MELTGKAKKDFEKWRKQQNFHVDAPYFYELKYSMQYGVYVDFFDSKNIYLDINSDIIQSSDGKIGYESVVYRNYYDFACYKSIIFKTRPEARIEAIKKANEIYNSR